MSRLTGWMNRVNDIRIKKKLMITYFVVVFIPVLIVGVFLTVQYRQNVLEQATEQTINNVERIKQRTTELIRTPTDISYNLMGDISLMNTVNTEYKSTLEVFQAYWNYRNFKEYLRFYKELHSIRFYTTNRTMLDNWEFIKVNDEISRSYWYRTAMEQGGIHWYYFADETNSNKKYLSLVRKIIYPQYRTSAVLVVSLDQEQLNAIVHQEPFDTMILDENGTIVAANNPEWTGSNISDLAFAGGLIDKPAGTYEFNYENKPSKIFVEELFPDTSRNGLKIVSVFAIDSIVSEAKRVSQLGFSIMAGSLLIALVLIYFFSGFLSKRMLILNRELNKVSLGDFNVTSAVSGNDEIGILSRQFNNMVSGIRRLMDEVSESHGKQAQLELRQREIKLKMMASQINPHFLFNALEAIRMKAHMNGQREISQVVRMLGKMIRRNLDVGPRHIPLEEELENVRYYLEIQKFRYGDERLTFRLDVDPDGKDLQIPPLILQPLVENAVVHGLENIRAGGVVTVITSRSPGGLRFEVTDNGCGIPEPVLETIHSALHDMEEEEHYRIGLRNVHQRLRMTYGEDFGLSIASEEGKGTSISFEIPFWSVNHA